MSSSDDSFILHSQNLIFHVPQPGRREKLCYLPEKSPLLNPMIQIPPPHAGFSLTLSPAAPRVLPVGPFTGYAAVLNRSRFLDPARQLLEEFCEFSGGEPADGNPSEIPSLDYVAREEGEQGKKALLISLIDEVCRRYQMYYQQVQNVITSFEMVAGLSSAAPYVSFALKSMSKHFKRLRDAMFDQFNLVDMGSDKEGFGRTKISSFGMFLQQDGSNLDPYRQPHSWRPQRGLPERAVAVLRAWLFEHFLHPYPTDVDKQMLAKQAGLTRNQVSNWFINARVRIWKPMVEEIHNLEMRQKLQKTVTVDHEEASKPSSSSNQHLLTSKFLNNNQLPYITNHIEDSYNYPCDGFSGRDLGGNGGSVSLTLGLRQNGGGGIRLPEPLPLNVARRFGLEDYGETFVVGALVKDRCWWPPSAS
nr:replumless [Erycina pusilla]